MQYHQDCGVGCTQTPADDRLRQKYKSQSQNDRLRLMQDAGKFDRLSCFLEIVFDYITEKRTNPELKLTQELGEKKSKQGNEIIEEKSLMEIFRASQEYREQKQFYYFCLASGPKLNQENHTVSSTFLSH